MNKKILLTIITMMLLLSVCVYSFAMDNVVNDVRDFVGDTENTVENVAGDAVDGVRDGINTVEGGTQNIVDDAEDGMQDVQNTVTGVTTDNGDDDGYTASMTSADQDVNNLTSNMWTWIVVGIFAIAIALMIWYYVKNKKSNNMYIDDDQDE